MSHMAKLTKQESKLHNQALDLVHSDKRLTFEDKLFVLENFQESQNNSNSLAGAFFTPWGLARDTAIDVGDGSVVDMCAGIGALSLAVQQRCNVTNHLCVELNPDYYLVGKRIVPEATWVNQDVFEASEWIKELIGPFDTAISNPPFGAIKTADNYRGVYTGSEFEYKLITTASEIARFGVFILPQQSVPFKYSGVRCFERVSSNKHDKFIKQTGIILEPGCGVDTSLYLKQWHGVSPLCEIVTTEFQS